MALPQLPLPVVFALPLIFLFLIVFTNLRYEFKPHKFVAHGTLVASLAISFVFLYALQKYDKMDANFPVVVRNIVFLADLALIHDPSLICFLIQYLDDFLNFNNAGFPIVIFEKELLSNIDNENEIFRIREAVSTLEDLSYQRISGENLIPSAVWYVVFVAATLLSIIFPMDTNIEQELDAVFSIILIWGPILTVYYLYLDALEVLDDSITELKTDLEILMKKKGIKCSKVIKDMQGELAGQYINRFDIGLLVGQ